MQGPTVSYYWFPFYPQIDLRNERLDLSGFLMISCPWKFGPNRPKFAQKFCNDAGRETVNVHQQR